MNANNAVAPVSHILLASFQQARERTHVYVLTDELTGDALSVTESFFKTLAKADGPDGPLQALAAREEAIQANRSLSAFGQVEEMDKAKADAHQSLQFVKKDSENKVTAEAEGRAKLMTLPKPAGDPGAVAVQDWEARDVLRASSLPERIRIVLQAIADGHVDAVRVIKGAPWGEELIPADVMKRAEAELLELQAPAELQRLKTLAFVGEQLAALATGIEMVLGSKSQVPTFKPKGTGRPADLGTKNTQEPPKKSAAVDNPPPGGSRQ